MEQTEREPTADWTRSAVGVWAFRGKRQIDPPAPGTRYQQQAHTGRWERRVYEKELVPHWKLRQFVNGVRQTVIGVAVIAFAVALQVVAAVALLGAGDGVRSLFSEIGAMLG